MPKGTDCAVNLVQTYVSDLYGKTNFKDSRAHWHSEFPETSHIVLLGLEKGDLKNLSRPEKKSLTEEITEDIIAVIKKHRSEIANIKKLARP